MNVRLLLLVLIAALLGCAAMVWPANPQPAPLTVVALKAMIDRPEANLVIVDSRGADEFQEAHIRGAVNIPLTTQEKKPQSLRFAKEAKIVFYCNGFS